MKRILHFFFLFSILAAAHAQVEEDITMAKPTSESEIQQALRKLTLAQFAINRFYVDTINTARLTEDAINGMLKSLDPHSSYTNAKQTKSLNEPLNGNFEGIGVQFTMLEDTLVVIQAVPKGPSQKAGVQAGDRIITVNDTAIAGIKMPQTQIMNRLRGRKGTHVVLGIRRVGVPELIKIEVVRDKIPLHTLDAAYMLTPRVGYIRFSSFGLTTPDEVHEAILNLKDKGMKDLILDLQENGGGYLEPAGRIAGEFLQKDDLIVYTKGRSVRPTEIRAKGGGIFSKGKLAVLIDEYSASAAEILSGAIQDHDRGIIVGRRSFGKGLVQQPIPLPDGSMIRLTVARYYTPSGRCIQKPYKKGESEAYRLDIINRYRNGELQSPDSIHLADSLKYQTLHRHRTVYGGGGIMPDYFVPLDTTRTTRYYRELLSKGVVLTQANRYIDNHRRQLTASYTDFADFKKRFNAPEDFAETVFAAGEKLNVHPKDEAEKTRTIPLVQKLLKALAARDTWDTSEYFEIVNEDDATILKALELLK